MPQSAETLVKNRFERRISYINKANAEEIDPIDGTVEIIRLTTEYCKTMKLLNSPHIDRRP